MRAKNNLDTGRYQCSVPVGLYTDRWTHPSEHSRWKLDGSQRAPESSSVPPSRRASDQVCSCRWLFLMIGFCHIRNSKFFLEPCSRIPRAYIKLRTKLFTHSLYFPLGRWLDSSGPPGLGPTSTGVCSWVSMNDCTSPTAQSHSNGGKTRIQRGTVTYPMSLINVNKGNHRRITYFILGKRVLKEAATS